MIDPIIETHVQSYNIAITLADPKRPDCPLVLANTAFEKLTGYRQADVQGQNCRFLQGPQTDLAKIAKCADAISEYRGTDVCLLNYRKNGDSFHNYLVLSPLKLRNGPDLFLGCQYEIPDVFNQPGYESQIAQVVDLVEALGCEPDRIFFETLRMRSEAAQMKIRAYLSRANAAV